MDQRLKDWHPSKQEVERIVAELRPIIRDLARRDQEAIAREIFFRRLAKVG